jgi:hypothetical protein
MERPIRTFALAFVGHWWEMMGCAAFTFLSIYSAQSNRSNAWGVSASVFLAVCFFMVAAYRTWKPEHDARRKAEAELNAKPDMKGTISATILQYNPMEDQAVDGSSLSYDCDCSNHGRAGCEINKVSVILSGPEFPSPRREVKNIMSRQVGPGQQFRLRDDFVIPGIKQSKLRKAQISLHLIDSLGIEYLKTTTEIVRR